ncbi:MAG: TonB-dependent receptor [Saprospiraceae bacterium]|nr:TonB-dependent receptor [Saprospiraceae bacterium]
MKAFLILFLAMGMTIIASAQSGKLEVSGSVTDSSGLGLEWASVLLFNPEDSTMGAFAYTDMKGAFTIKNVKPKEYILKVGYLGMGSYEQKITVTANMKLDPIRLSPEATLIEGAEVTAARIPILIKKDTIEYDAQSFKVAPNSNVEELLKRLPGVEVEADGTVKAQGETVQNVMVDGKRFFGNDPKMATKNLPADAVDKVQVYDRRSDNSEFTGIDDGSREKTINLILKPDRKNGAFGYASGAYGGPDNRYDAKLSLNQFSDSRQMALLAGSNNINNQGFSFQDYMQFSGGMQNIARGGGGNIRMGGGSDSGLPISNRPTDGFSKASNVGFQFTQRYGQENELNTSYFFNQFNQSIDKELNRLSFLPVGNFTTDENSFNASENLNHRLNIAWDQRLDTFTAIKVISNLSFTNSFADNFQYQVNRNAEDSFISDYDTDLKSSGVNWRWNGSVSLRRKFEKRGRNFGLTVAGRYSQQDEKTRLDALNREMFGGILSELAILQDQTQNNSNHNFSINAQYTEPIGNRQYLEAQYLYNKNPMKNVRQVFDILGDNDLVLNDTLSSAYNAAFDYHRAGLSYRLVRDRTNFSVGVNWQNSFLNGVVVGVDQPINRTFNYILPNIRWNFEVERAKNINLNYETSIREPSITQLQPLPNNTDPNNIYLGNAGLQPEYTHRVNARYSSFDIATFSNFFIFINASITKDKISESITTNEQLSRIRKPINVSQASDMSFRGNFGAPIKAISGLRYNVGAGINFNKSLAEVNMVENETYRVTPSTDLRLFYQWGSYFDMDASTTLLFINTKYSVNSDQNQEFQTYSHRYNIRINWPDKWQLSTGINLIQNRGQAGTFNQDVPIWTASLSRFVFKKDKGEIKLIAYDLLNRNLGITRNSDINYIEDSRVLSLGRYFLVEFRYNINSTPGMMGGRGGMMNMIKSFM